jgi:hypothetical protein
LLFFLHFLHWEGVQNSLGSFLMRRKIRNIAFCCFFFIEWGGQSSVGGFLMMRKIKSIAFCCFFFIFFIALSLIVFMLFYT